MPIQNVPFCVHLPVNFDTGFNRKISIAIPIHHQRYQQVLDKPTQKTIQNPGRAITTAVTF